MIKILRKVSLRLHCQTFYNASTLWLEMKIETEPSSDLPLVLQPSVPAQCWAGLGGTVPFRVRHVTFTNLTLELPKVPFMVWMVL